MKLLKKISSICLTILIACTLMIPFVNTVQASAEYEIVFKGGLHGTVDGKSSVSYRIPAGNIFPNEASVQVEEGYVFTGWNKKLPAVGSKVDRKLVFVAKYDVLVNGINYMVRYVNEKNEAIATPKSMMAEVGTKIIERAKVLPGYAFKEAQQEFILSETNKEIRFVYTSTDVREQIRYEEEIINEVDGTVENNNNNPNQNQGQDPTVDEKENIKDEEIVDKEKTPLAKGEKDDDNGMLLGIGSALGIGLLLIAIAIVLKKRKESTE